MYTLNLISWAWASISVQVLFSVSADKTLSGPDARNGHSIASTVVTPKKLLLFSKALHGIVASHCRRNVDDLALDAFQAYLNRQILKGDVKTIRHSSHFNKIYRGILECAGTISDPSLNHAPSPDKEMRTSLGITEGLGLISKPTTPGFYENSDDSKHEVNFHSSAIQQPDSKKTQDAIPEQSFATKVLKDGSSVIANKTKKWEQTGQRSTAIDKFFNNAIQLVSKIIDKGKDFLSGMLQKSKSSFKWFARRKRDTDLTQMYKKPSSDLREAIDPAPQIAISSNKRSSDDQHGLLWKSVTSTETRNNTMDHFSMILKSYVHISLAKCSNYLEKGDRPYISKILDLICLMVENDLKEGEDVGLHLRINEQLVDDLRDCIIST